MPTEDRRIEIHGGRRTNIKPRAVIFTVAGDEYSVGQTPLEIQEMQELAYKHGAPHALIEFTCAWTETAAPWHGKPLLVRADCIIAVAPPYGVEEET